MGGRALARVAPVTAARQASRARALAYSPLLLAHGRRVMVCLPGGILTVVAALGLQSADGQGSSSDPYAALLGAAKGNPQHAQRGRFAVVLDSQSRLARARCVRATS